MKHFNKLLCTAIAALWVLPVSALEFDQRTQVNIDTSDPELESFGQFSNWFADDVDEYLYFEAADYALHFELFNVTLVGTTGTLVIEAYDKSGVLLGTSSTLGYTVNTSSVPFVLSIDGVDHSAANNFVQNLPFTQPHARRVQLKMTLSVNVQNCNQHVSIHSWLRYDGALVATSLPDHTVVPRDLICP